jgi:hypothetical protein
MRRGDSKRTAIRAPEFRETSRSILSASGLPTRTMSEWPPSGEAT